MARIPPPHCTSMALSSDKEVSQLRRPIIIPLRTNETTLALSTLDPLWAQSTLHPTQCECFTQEVGERVWEGEGGVQDEDGHYGGDTSPAGQRNQTETMGQSVSLF